MSNLTERLRGNGAVPVTVMTKTLCNEAADEIERLTAELEHHKGKAEVWEDAARAAQARVEELEADAVLLNKIIDGYERRLEGPEIIQSSREDIT